MKTVAPFLALLALSLAAAVSAPACDRYVSLSDFDTSCHQDSDCILVYIGPSVCCPQANAAINASDEAKYESEIEGQDKNDGCDVECGVFGGQMEMPVCNAGTCALQVVDSVADGGVPDSGTLCGSFICSDGGAP